MSKDCNNI